MRDFEYQSPKSILELCDALRTHGDEAKIMAGGTAMMLAMRQRLLSPARIFSIARIPELQGIYTDDAGNLHIGAYTTHTAIAESALCQDKHPMLSKMAGGLANWQVRNQGTLGGNLCYADPSTDPPGCLMALDAKLVIQSSSGRRTLNMLGFCVDYFETALQPNEVLVSVVIPSLPPGATCTYERHLKTPADHRPIANLSIVSWLDDQGLKSFRIVVAAATPFPMRLTTLENELTDAKATEATVGQAVQSAVESLPTLSDSRADSAYRQRIVGVLLERHLHKHLN
jgi:carbon-monoxide dehydrogenase medium subunit